MSYASRIGREPSSGVLNLAKDKKMPVYKPENTGIYCFISQRIQEFTAFKQRKGTENNASYLTTMTVFQR